MNKKVVDNCIGELVCHTNSNAKYLEADKNRKGLGVYQLTLRTDDLEKIMDKHFQEFVDET